MGQLIHDGLEGVMPKINVDDEAVHGFRLEVCWANEKYVQVGTTNEHSKVLLDTGEQPGEQEILKGWFVTLNRDGINRAIRALRKARDAAFGADA